MRKDCGQNSKRVASGQRFVTLLLALAVLALLLGWLRMASPNAKLEHLLLYGIVIGFEWVLLGIVLWRSDLKWKIHLGSAPYSARSVLLDLLTAALLCVALLSVSPVVISVSGKTGWVSTESMLPRGGSEIAAWVVMAISAGICEETVFRGYLQRQISEWTGFSGIGIVGQAALFGLCHLYQGWKNAILIAVWGCIFGIAALWRRNLRGNMLAHAVLDIFSAF